MVLPVSHIYWYIGLSVTIMVYAIRCLPDFMCIYIQNPQTRISTSVGEMKSEIPARYTLETKIDNLLSSQSCIRISRRKERKKSKPHSSITRSRLAIQRKQTNTATLARRTVDTSLRIRPPRASFGSERHRFGESSMLAP